MLSNLSIKIRLFLVLIIGALGLVILSIFALAEIDDGLIGAYDRQLKTISDAAYSTVQSHYDAYQAGDVTLEEAQANAAKAVSVMRYEGKNYLWINDLDGVLVMHPHRAERVGESMLELTDAKGTKIYQEFVAAAREGGGFVEYFGRRPGADEKLTSPKKAYIQTFGPWDWAIGTGHLC